MRRKPKRKPDGRDRTDAVRKHREGKRAIDRPAPADMARRERLEADTAEWLRWYLADAFPLQFAQFHHDVIAGAEQAVTTGTNFEIIGPRGSGKSTLLWGVALKLVLRGAVRYPIVLPWDAKAVHKALRFWKIALCFNERIHADYPEICEPFRQSGGRAQKCLTLTWKDGSPTGAQLLVSQGKIILPDSRGAIGSSTINGNPRGMSHTCDNGEVLRPDLALLDDPQDRKIAKSVAQTTDIIEMIETDAIGMSGPSNRMPAIMAATVIKRGDVATHYRNATGWKSVCYPQIMAWPKRMDLWDKWNDVMNDEGEPAALSMYASEGEAMRDGMSVYWLERYDRVRGEPDAYYSAMRDFYKMGAAFLCERQNEPPSAITTQYELTPEIVMSHATDMPRLSLPESCGIVVGYCDINHYGLHWCVAGFAQDSTGHCPAYGRWPGRGNVVERNAPELARNQAIFAGLKAVCDGLDATVFRRGAHAVKVGLLLIDVQYAGDAVQRFAQQARYSFRVMPAAGRPAQHYRVKQDTLLGRPFEQAHIQRAGKVGHAPYLVIQSHYWHEVAQRAFLGPVGAPGVFTLHAPSTPREHLEFAEHVCAERLTNKYETPMGWRWEYTAKPGSRWDYGDAYAGCWAAAAASGLSASGNMSAATPAVTRRRAGGISVIQM